MVVIIKDKKLEIKKSQKLFFNLFKDVKNNLKYKIDYIIKYNECLAEETIKIDISLLLSKYKHRKYIHEHRKTNENNCKTNKPHKFVLNFLQIFDL